MVFFYRRFLPLDVCIYAFGAENDASSSNLPIPFIKLKRLSQNLHLRQPRFFDKGDRQICGRSGVFRPEGVYEDAPRKETAVEKDH